MIKVVYKEGRLALCTRLSSFTTANSTSEMN